MAVAVAVAVGKRTLEEKLDRKSQYNRRGERQTCRTGDSRHIRRSPLLRWASGGEGGQCAGRLEGQRQGVVERRGVRGGVGDKVTARGIPLSVLGKSRDLAACWMLSPWTSWLRQRQEARHASRRSGLAPRPTRCCLRQASSSARAQLYLLVPSSYSHSQTKTALTPQTQHGRSFSGLAR